MLTRTLRLATRDSPLVFYALLVLAMLFWGGSWVSSKLVAVENPLALTAVRFAISFVSLLPIFWWTRSRLPRSKAFYGWAFLAATALTAYNWLFFYGLKLGEAGQSGVLVTTLNPIWTVVFSQFFFRFDRSKELWWGLGVGFLGGLIQVAVPMSLGIGLNPQQLVIFVGASALYALLTVAGQKAQTHARVPEFSLILHAIATVLAFLPLLPDLSVITTMHWNPALVGHLLYISLLSGTVATTLFFYGSNRIGPSRVASFNFLVPVFAVGLSLIILGEHPQWPSLVGGAVSLLAVWIINRYQFRSIRLNK